MVRRCLLALLFASFVLYLPILARRAVCGFRLAKIASNLPFNPAWSTVELLHENACELQVILSQPFTYLAHGGQSFVFESEDGRFIIKFFRHSTVPHPWRKKLRSFLLGRKGHLTPEKKTDRLLTACKLAYERAKDLTGLVYIHLNTTDKKLPSTLLKDRLKRVHQIDLNKYSFAIQYKGKAIRIAFQEMIENNDRQQFLKLTNQFGLLLKERTNRHLGNTDTKVGPNFGFLSDRAIEWDFGNYWLDEKLENPDFRKQEMQVFSEHLQSYLYRVAPHWASDAWEILEAYL